MNWEINFLGNLFQIYSPHPLPREKCSPVWDGLNHPPGMSCFISGCLGPQQKFNIHRKSQECNGRNWDSWMQFPGGEIKNHLCHVADLRQGQNLSKSFLTCDWLSHSHQGRRRFHAHKSRVQGWLLWLAEGFFPDVQPKEHSLNQIIACWKATRAPGTVTLFVMQMERSLTEHPLSWAVPWIFRITPWLHYRTVYWGLSKKQKWWAHTFICIKYLKIYFSYI